LANKIYNTANECDAVYCYPGSRTLKNKLGITDADALEAAEREIVFARYAGYAVDFSDVSADEMISASQNAFKSDYSLMEKLFERIVTSL